MITNKTKGQEALTTGGTQLFLGCSTWLSLPKYFTMFFVNIIPITNDYMFLTVVFKSK